MGTGKTAVGKVLAARLGRRLVESDAVIEKLAGKSIPDIFRQDGEITFRELEIQSIKQISRGRKQVIACGGGVVLNIINIERLRQSGVVVLLTGTPSTVLRRTKSVPGSRPLLDVPDPLARIRELMKFRRPLYQRAADITVDTSKLDVTGVADLIIEKLREYEGFNIKE